MSIISTLFRLIFQGFIRKNIQYNLCIITIVQCRMALISQKNVFLFHLHHKSLFFHQNVIT